MHAQALTTCQCTHCCRPLAPGYQTSPGRKELEAHACVLVFARRMRLPLHAPVHGRVGQQQRQQLRQQLAAVAESRQRCCCCCAEGASQAAWAQRSLAGADMADKAAGQNRCCVDARCSMPQQVGQGETQ